MSTAENKAIVKDFIEAGNRGDVEGSVKYTAPDCRLNGQPFGREGDRQRHVMMLAAFPGGKDSIDEMIAENEKEGLRNYFVLTSSLDPFTIIQTYIILSPSVSRYPNVF